MSRKRTITLLAVLTCVTGMVRAQLFSDDYFIRKINLRVLRALDEYGRKSTFLQTRYYEEYYALFVNDNVEVPLDVLQMGLMEKKVPIEKYIKLNRDNWSPEEYGLDVEMIVEDVGPICDEAWSRDRHTGTVKIQAIKVISGYAHPKCGCKEPLRDSIALTITYRFDYEGNKYLIEDIDAQVKGRKRVILVARIQDLFRTAATGNFPVEMARDGLEPRRDTTDSVGFLKSVQMDSSMAWSIAATDKKFEGKVSRVTILRSRESSTEKVPKFSCGSYDTLAVDFRLPVLAIEPEIGFLPLGLPLVSAPKGDVNIENSHASHVAAGLRAGIFLRQSQKGYWLLKTGVSYEGYGYRLKVDTIATAYDTVDPTGVHYLRTDSLFDIQETRRLGYISVPLVLERGFLLPFRLRAYFTAGGRILLPLVQRYEGTASALYSGRYYAEHFNAYIRENGVYDFGSFSLSSKGQLNVRNPLIVAELGAGLRRQIVKRLDIGFGFRYSLSIQSILQASSLSMLLSRNASELNSLGVIDARPRMRCLSITAGILFKI